MKMMAAALLPVAAVAPAQPSRMPTEDFGRCVTERDPGAARALLATEMGSWDEVEQARRLLDPGVGCDRPNGNLRAGDIRGLVAEGLLEADSAAMARLRARPSASPPVRAPAELDGRAFVAAYAACLADAAPASSLTLLGTAHRSQAEIDAFTAYGDTLNDCMPEARSARIDRSDVRHHVAAHLYKRAMEAEAAR